MLARYPKERSPLRSGYLAGPERLEGKAAALSVDYGKGHVILLGFKPQWRGQSHAALEWPISHPARRPPRPVRDTIRGRRGKRFRPG